MTSETGGIKVVYGNPDDSELAAVMCVLLAARCGMPQFGEFLGQAVSAAPGGNQEPLLQHVFWRVVPVTSRPSTPASVASGTRVRRRRSSLRVVRTHAILR